MRAHRVRNHMRNHLYTASLCFIYSIALSYVNVCRCLVKLPTSCVSASRYRGDAVRALSCWTHPTLPWDFVFVCRMKIINSLSI